METIEQAKNSYENTVAGKNGFYRGVLWAQRWIDIEKELPEYYGVVLIKCKQQGKNHRLCVAWLSAEDDGSLIFTIDGTKEYIPFDQVIAWRPINRE